ncbi:hypothetical protein DL770_006019 [Monosporascus sp. CRB-9-2]|nr:hypothetical protein DL770_006019 [Monosporascus sp. CRB-9-2]
MHHVLEDFTEQAALQAFRSKWIHLCTDHSRRVDQVEKATQIPLTGDTYKNSENVLIWLGEEVPEDKGSLEFARFLEAVSYRDRTPIQDQYVWAFRTARRVPPPHDEMWKKLFVLFKRPCKLLTRTQRAAATNPLDKIYGLWAVADRSNIAQLSITPSYRITVENLYRDVAMPREITGISRLHGGRKHFGPRGHIIGMVDEVSCTLRREPGPAAMYPLQQDLRDWERVAGARSGIVYRNGKHILNCYWQTLCAGVMPGGYQVCQEELRRYNAVTRTLQSFADLSQYDGSLINALPGLKMGVSASALVFHACFRSFTVMEDMRGFQGNNGAMIGRRMARTDTGYIRLVPEET